MGESDGDRDRPGRAPVTVLWAAAIVAAQGLAVLSLAPIVLIGGILLSTPDSVGRAWAEVGMALAAGAAIVLLARALSRAALWSRGPVVVIQILALPLGYSLAFGSQLPVYGLPLLAAAGAVLYLLLFPPESRLVFLRQ